MGADGIASRFDSVAYPAANERIFQTILATPLGGTSFLRARPGVRTGGGLTVTVDSTGDGTATVAGGAGIITDTGAGVGSYFFALSSAKTLSLPTRPGAGTSRIDEVVAHILNVDERVGDGAGNRYVEIYLISGTAGASPVAPSIPSGQLRLAELTVPSSGTILVSKPAQRFTALGGILPVASQAERDAISDIYDGLMVYREDTDVYESRANGAWVAQETKQDTGWSSISLHTGFTAQTGPPDATPQKRTLRGNEVKLRGRVNGTFGASSDVLIADAGAVPSPPRQMEKQVSTNSADKSCRAFITTTGEIHIITGPSAPAYVYLDGLSGYMLD